MLTRTVQYQRKTVILLLLIVSCWVNVTQAGEIFVGTSSVDITPKLPFALLGQFHLRIAYTTTTSLTANVVAIESYSTNGTNESAILVSCDLTVITPALLKAVREEVAQRLPGLEVNKIILTATHTHTAPVLGNENLTYPIPKDGVTQPDSALAFVSHRISDAIEKAWKSRRTGSVSWGLSHAVIGYNRRSVYADGKAVMYGASGIKEYIGPEGYEDHDINTLFFWNHKGKLIATAINVACPAQEVGGDSTVNADFWHNTRIALKKRFGDDLCVLGWVAAAGDQSPSLMYRHAAEARMHRLRQISRMAEIARRITVAVEEAYNTVKRDRHNLVPFKHIIDTLYLPMRLVGEEEYLLAKKNRDKIAARIVSDPEKNNDLQAEKIWYEQTMEWHEKQQKTGSLKFQAEIHILRIGDAVLCTNPFELFVDYGIRIQGRSKAIQTFVVQLAGAGNYLPTAKALKGGGYSVTMMSSWVGPQGGDMLVDKTVNHIDRLWRREE